MEVLTESDHALLEAAVERSVGPDAQIQAIQSLPIEQGISGALVRRYELALANAAQPSMCFVVKPAARHERRLSLLLYAQEHAGIPFYLSLDEPDTEWGSLCILDLGDETRPHVLAPIDAGLERAEAARLAAIHCANLGRADAFAWLPRADRAYFTSKIEREAFRPSWNAIRDEPAFVQRFGAEVIAQVDDAADAIVDEMVQLSADGATPTLVHTDINPSNVRVVDGQPYFIDWEAAHYGSLYLDIPHHYPTLEKAQIFRSALLEQGLSIPEAEFSAAYRVAARYTGLRYIWWTLEGWRDDPEMDVWVEHYLRMIAG